MFNIRIYMKNIGALLPKFEKKFKLLQDQTLFGPDWTNLKNLRCIHCASLLKENKKGILYCISKLHKRRFVIKREVINSFKF